MKKIKRSLGEHLQQSTLYYDDLLEIVNIFNEASDDLRISAEDYALDNLEEINEIKKDQLESISISIHNPHIGIDIKRNETWLYASNDNNETRGIYEKVKQILTKRKRRLSWFFNSNWITFPLVIILVFFGNWIGKEDHRFVWIELIIFLLALFILLIHFWGFFRWRNRIFTKHRAEFPSFWRSKKDDIILAVISAIVGAGIYFIISLFLVK